jgi:hypothetical protein
MVRREDDHLRRSARVADSVRRDSSARLKPARIIRRWEASMRGGCARRIVRSSCSLPRDLSWEKSRAAACRWVPAVGGVASMRRTMCRPLAGRCRVECLTRLPTAVGSSAATCQPFRSRVLLAVGAGPTASKQLHVTWASVEGWRSIATRDGSKIRAPRRGVKRFSRRGSVTLLLSQPTPQCALTRKSLEFKTLKKNATFKEFEDLRDAGAVTFPAALGWVDNLPEPPYSLGG